MSQTDAVVETVGSTVSLPLLRCAGHNANTRVLVCYRCPKLVVISCMKGCLHYSWNCLHRQRELLIIIMLYTTILDLQRCVCSNGHQNMHQPNHLWVEASPFVNEIWEPDVGNLNKEGHQSASQVSSGVLRHMTAGPFHGCN